MHVKQMESQTRDTQGSPVQSNGHHIYIPATSVAMRSLERVLADIAPTDIPVLLVGESGTGKEVIAYHIHRLSSRHELPFAKLTCAALAPEDFNGRQGNGDAFHFSGTLLLDEVSELDAACQSKVLHALLEGEPDARNVGPHGTRIICTTSRNLEEEMRAGRFREELYYRVNGMCLRLPPLRHRKEDIPVLADFFLTKYSALFGRPLPELPAGVLARMMEHVWPGNVRELENAMRKVVALGDARAILADLGEPNSELPRQEPASVPPLKEAARAASRQAERELILKVLGKTRWNRKRAAQELQISYKALLYKLKQIGVDDTVAS